MTDQNLINLHDKIAELEIVKMTCDWDSVQIVQDKITAYQTKLLNGITFEPAF